MKPVFFHSSAERELLEASKYYESKQKNLGIQFLESIDSAVKRLQINPSIYSLVTGNIRKCRVKVFPYGIIFRELSESIQIIAVMHLHREPGYWKERI